MLNSGTTTQRIVSNSKSPQIASQFDVALYIRDLASQLQHLSQKSDLTVLCCLLSMVVLEASETVDRLSEAENPS